MEELITIDCLLCGGEGRLENDDPSLWCINQSNECCGSCTGYVDCFHCNSSGQITAIDEEMDDYMRMYSAYQVMIKNLVHVRENIRAIHEDDSEDALMEMNKMMMGYDKEVKSLTAQIKRIKNHMGILEDLIIKGLDDHHFNNG